MEDCWKRRGRLKIFNGKWRLNLVGRKIFINNWNGKGSERIGEDFKKGEIWRLKRMG